ncbi:MAG: hypothetical protein ACOYXT_25395, partial [Bacteroidota bacterium]
RVHERELGAGFPVTREGAQKTTGREWNVLGEFSNSQVTLAVFFYSTNCSINQRTSQECRAMHKVIYPQIK